MPLRLWAEFDVGAAPGLVEGQGFGVVGGLACWFEGCGVSRSRSQRSDISRWHSASSVWFSRNRIAFLVGYLRLRGPTRSCLQFGSNSGLFVDLG